MHQLGDQHIGGGSDGQHRIIVLQLGPQCQAAEPRQRQRKGRNVGQRQRPLGQLHPVQRHQPHHLRERDGDDDEIGAAHPERQPADQITAQRRNRDRQHEADGRRPGIVHDMEATGHLHIEAERGQRADIGADAEERHMAETQLPREAEQQIEAHRCDDEDAGRDQRIEQVRVPQPQRHRNEGQNADHEHEGAIHPTRSILANNPVGLNSSTTMMIRKPMASR